MHRCYLATIDKIANPRFFHEAIKDPKWRESMAKEIESLEENKLEDGVLSNYGQERSLLTANVKYKEDGTIERYKARLVIWGDEQIEGFNYNETFTRVAKMTSVHIFLSVAAAKSWELCQMDVNNAFLYGDLNEEV